MIIFSGLSVKDFLSREPITDFFFKFYSSGYNIVNSFNGDQAQLIT